MSKASSLAHDLVTRPLSPKEIERRREAAKPRVKLTGTLHGQLAEKTTTTPLLKPRVIQQAEEQPYD
jgi:hypothetical protein